MVYPTTNLILASHLWCNCTRLVSFGGERKELAAAITFKSESPLRSVLLNKPLITFDFLSLMINQFAKHWACFYFSRALGSGLYKRAVCIGRHKIAWNRYSWNPSHIQPRKRKRNCKLLQNNANRNGAIDICLCDSSTVLTGFSQCFLYALYSALQ